MANRLSFPRLPSGTARIQFLLGGWTLLVLAFLYLPILLLMVYSFNDSRLNVRWEGFTVKWYAALASNKTLLDSLKNSLIVAAFTTAVSVFMGTVGAWLIYRYKVPVPRLFGTLLLIPMIIPEVIMGVSLLILFTLITRTVNGWLMAMGLGENILGLGLTTVTISHITFCFPFVLVAVQARLAGMDPALEEAALDLGATPVRAFTSVIVPYMLPAIISGAMMTFTLSMDEYLVTIFTAGPGSRTLPLEVFGMARVGLNPQLNALSTLFIVVTAALVTAAQYVQRWNR